MGDCVLVLVNLLYCSKSILAFDIYLGKQVSFWKFNNAVNILMIHVETNPFFILYMCISKAVITAQFSVVGKFSTWQKSDYSRTLFIQWMCACHPLGFLGL